MLRHLRFRLSLKITLLVTAFLAVTFLIVTPIITDTMTNQAKQSLVSQSKSFASLSTRPIGDAFLLYRDSGLARLRQQVQKITEIDTYIGNTLIVDVNGTVLYEHRETSTTILPEQAASFEPIYESDDEGFVSRVIYPFAEQSGAHRFTMVYEINSAEIKATLSTLQNNILFAAVAVTVLADVVLLISIEFLFVRPLKRMSQLAASIRAGDYDQSIKTKRSDEIGELGGALNEMAQKLKADIEALKHAEKLKSEFLIISSHNFRTPLTVITGYLDLLRDVSLDKQTREYMDTIETYAKQLNQLTNDMLTVAELEGNDKPKVSLETINLSEMLHNLVPSVEKHLVKKQQQLETLFGDADTTVEVHATYLQTALWNLIDNASKFSPEKGTVTLAVQKTADEVLIDVKDTGTGIGEEEKAHLFTKFHRGTSIMQYEYEGVGLGLYMTKLMLEFMGGSITVESTEGKGSTFTIHLPRRSAATSITTGSSQVVPIGRTGSLKITPTDEPKLA